MSKFKAGDVVIVSTRQAGTVWFDDGREVAVLLANGDYWYGDPEDCRKPAHPDELKACVLNVPKKWANYKADQY